MSSARVEAFERLENQPVAPVDIFPVDQHQVLQTHPEIRACTDALVRYMDDEGEEVYVEGVSVQKLATRAVLRENRSREIREAAEVMYCHGAQLALQFDDEAEQLAALQAPFAGLFTAGTAYDDFVNIHMNVIKMSATCAQDIREQGRRWLERQHFDDTDESIRREYEIIRSVAHDTATEEDAIEGNRVPSQVLAGMMLMTDPEICRALAARLEAGMYDRLIAAELLDYIGTQEQLQNGFSKINQMVRFFSAALEGEPSAWKDAYVRDRLLAVVPEWPVDQRIALVQVREDMGSRFDKVITTIRRYVEANIISNVSNPAAAYEQSVTNLALVIAKHSAPGTYSQSTIMRAKVDQKRRRRQQTQAAPVVAESGPIRPEREPLTLLQVNPNGTMMPEGINEVKDAYLKKYGQSNVVLREDVERILAHMQQLDYASGEHVGAKKINKVTINLSDGTSRELYEFKPLEAKGCSTRSSAAKSIRVCFVFLDSSTLGVVDIVDRRDAERLYARIRKQVKL